MAHTSRSTLWGPGAPAESAPAPPIRPLASPPPSPSAHGPKSTATDHPPPPAGSANAWEQAYDKARELAGQKGLAAGMQLLEDGLAEAREPRDRFYWRLASARLMKDSGLKSLATQQIQDLQMQVRGLALEDWEPALIRQLEKLG